MGIYRTHKENAGVAWQSIENTWKTLFGMRTYGKRNENTSVALERMEHLENAGVA